MFTDAQLAEMSPEGRAKAWAQMSEADRQKALADRELRRAAGASGGGFMDTAVDVAKSAGAGLARGVVGLAGLPGTLSDLTDTGLTNLGKFVGVIPDDWQAPNRSALSGANLIDTMSQATGGATDFRGNTTAGKYAGTIAEFVPGGPTKKLASFATQTLAPAVLSEAAGQMAEGSDMEGIARLGGALAAPALIAGGRRVVTPHQGATPEYQAAARVLEDAGVPLTAGQKVDSKGLRRTEALFGDDLIGGPTQQKAFTRAALKTAGIDADLATPAVLDQGAKDIGKVFDRMLVGTTITPNPTNVAKLKLARDEYRATTNPTAIVPVVDDVLRGVQTAAQMGRPIPPKLMQTWRTRLSRLSTNKDPATREAAAAALAEITDMINAGLVAAGRTTDVADLALAREQWRNFLAVQDAAASAAPGTGFGYLSPTQFRNAVKKQGAASFARGGRGDVGELAAAGKEILPPPGTSGTAENLAAMGVPMVTGGGILGTLGSMVAGPVGAGVGAVAGMVAPTVIGKVKTSGLGQKYLANQYLKATPGGGFIPATAQAAKPFATGAETQSRDLLDLMFGAQ